ncbi:type II toxin-antitoxin system VapC family toxin [Leifsonia flava]|uniref:PIN domain nuclease n=1 Tax=Orlajensenia leifsoniae TaxID=2561933 RepID=A0A4Y9QW71_9MICO|nr:PIN domain nuclease [Leifsonia flava]TFV95383.1 PIN domain nuclease [Leifsonia flava]
MGGPVHFTATARILRRALLDIGYGELVIGGTHAIVAAELPSLHKDPHDRMLLARARIEGLTLLTADEAVAACGSPARLI